MKRRIWGRRDGSLPHTPQRMRAEVATGTGAGTPSKKVDELSDGECGRSPIRDDHPRPAPVT